MHKRLQSRTNSKNMDIDGAGRRNQYLKQEFSVLRRRVASLTAEQITLTLEK